MEGLCSLQLLRDERAGTLGLLRGWEASSLTSGSLLPQPEGDSGHFPWPTGQSWSHHPTHPQGATHPQTRLTQLVVCHQGLWEYILQHTRYTWKNRVSTIPESQLFHERWIQSEERRYSMLLIVWRNVGSKKWTDGLRTRQQILL